MLLINENYGPLMDQTIGNEDKFYWEYDLQKEDFFLRRSLLWYSIKTDCYTIEVNGKTVNIPFNFHMLIGDFDSGLDAIKPEEIVGRSFDLVTFNSRLTSSSIRLVPMRIVGYKHGLSFMLPQTKNLLMVYVSEETSILVSQTDFFGKIKNISFGGE